MQPKTLRTVTDRFNIFKNSRKLSGNKRNYVLTAVRQLFESAETRESMQLGELYGYYGHGRRQLSGSLDIPEVSVMILEGKPVVIENVPSNRTVEVSIDDDGTVTHTQEIFVTEPGKIVSGLIDSNAGGWSWAMGGAEGRRVVPRAFGGFDYVGAPNYISLDHPSFLLESGSTRAQQRELLLESLQTQGYTPEAARTISDHFDAMLDLNADVSGLSEDVLLLEGLLVESNSKINELDDIRKDLSKTVDELNQKNVDRRKLLLEAVSRLPFNVSEQQIDALVEMNSEDDAKAVSALFESILRRNFDDLPLPGKKHQSLSVKINKGPDIHPNTIVTFSKNGPTLFK